MPASDAQPAAPNAMKPELFQIPWIHYGIKSYGFMMMIGFLTGIYWASRRASKTRGNPDLVLNLGFLALVFGVVGARAFYVIHYWERSFAARPWDALDLTAGGLEFYGGFIGAMVFIIAYLCAYGRPAVSWLLGGLWSLLVVLVLAALYGRFAPAPPAGLIVALVFAGVAFYVLRAIWRWAVAAGRDQPISLRLYLDIISPSLMWGLAFGRMGCFLNGCCWGGTCSEHLPWAVRFPCGSPAQIDQWEQRLASLPAPLMDLRANGSGQPIYRELLTLSPEDRERILARYERARKSLSDAIAANAPARTVERRRAALKAHDPIIDAVNGVSRNAEMYGLTFEELQELARRPENKSLRVHPAQLYDVVNAMLLSFFLNAVFYRRKRHGVVFGLMWVCYPVTRLVLETIRADNPLDTAGLTISQGVSILGLVFAGLWFAGLRRMPLRSPYAVPYVPPDEGPKR